MTKIRLATWNINSARLRMPQILRFLKEYDVDVLCLQEIKCQNEQFPQEELCALGYEHIALNGQKAYHGVATVSRFPLSTVEKTVFGGIDEARHLNIELTEDQAGGTSRCKFTISMCPLAAMWLMRRSTQNLPIRCNFSMIWRAAFEKQNGDAPPMILVGDLNIAPMENDVWSHKQMLKVVSHTPIEVEQLAKVAQSLDWIDALRCHVPDERKTVYLVELSGQGLEEKQSGPSARPCLDDS